MPRDDDANNLELENDNPDSDDITTDPLATVPAAAVMNPMLAGAVGAVVAQDELAEEESKPETDNDGETVPE